MSPEGAGPTSVRRGHPNFALSDGVRGVAATAVVVIHVAIFTIPLGEETLLDRGIIRLDVAFAVFFVLSAFLLYRPMIAHRNGGAPAPGVRGYAVRRGLRIYPAYWVALTCLAIFPGLLGVFGSDWFGFYSLLGNFDPPYEEAQCADQVFRCGLPQTWSLTAEMTFYVALPAYVWLTARIARDRTTAAWVRRELILIGAMAFASAAFSVEPLGLRDDPWFRFSLLGNMIWIGLGLALAVVSVAVQQGGTPRALRVAAGRPNLCWAAAAAIWALLVVTLPAQPYIVANESDGEFLASYFSFGVVSLLIMLPVAFPVDHGLPRRLLTARPVAWLGMIAYGIFLWHVTIAYNLGSGAIEAGFWVTLLFTFALTVPLAAGSYYLIEHPLTRPHRLIRRRSRSAARSSP